MFAFKLHSGLLTLIEDNGFFMLLVLGGISLIFLLPVAYLFFGGAYTWIRTHGNTTIKRTGRNKFLFSFYYLVPLIIPLIMIVWAAITSLHYQGYGEANSITTLQSFAVPTSGFGQIENIGFAVGGANDIHNFRENISNGYLPIPTDITHEGIFYDYTFATGLQEECADLFCPSYTTAVSQDPFLAAQNTFYRSV